MNLINTIQPLQSSPMNKRQPLERNKVGVPRNNQEFIPSQYNQHNQFVQNNYNESYYPININQKLPANPPLYHLPNSNSSRISNLSNHNPNSGTLSGGVFVSIDQVPVNKNNNDIKKMLIQRQKMLGLYQEEDSKMNNTIKDNPMYVRNLSNNNQKNVIIPPPNLPANPKLNKKVMVNDLSTYPS